MYEKHTQSNLSSLAAILYAILYQGSLINCSKTTTRSHFEPFYTWNNLHLMQQSELSSLYGVLISKLDLIYKNGGHLKKWRPSWILCHSTCDVR